LTTLAFDATPLNHFARASHVSTLQLLVNDYRCVVPEAVLDELRRGVAAHPELSQVLDPAWLEVVSLGTLPELSVFAQYARRLGSGPRHVGETAALAWAEVHKAIAIIDDKTATTVGRQRDVEVHGSIWLIVNGFKEKLLSETETRQLVDALRDTQARFPTDGPGFFDFCRQNGLL
jgi:predicted nucleic acid-binding protein